MQTSVWAYPLPSRLAFYDDGEKLVYRRACRLALTLSPR